MNSCRFWCSCQRSKGWICHPIASWCPAGAGTSSEASPCRCRALAGQGPPPMWSQKPLWASSASATMHFPAPVWRCQPPISSPCPAATARVPSRASLRQRQLAAQQAKRAQQAAMTHSSTSSRAMESMAKGQHSSRVWLQVTLAALPRPKQRATPSPPCSSGLLQVLRPSRQTLAMDSTMQTNQWPRTSRKQASSRTCGRNRRPARQLQ